MTTDDFALILLKNILESRDNQKVPFQGVIILLFIRQGVKRRRDLINKSGINCASFYSPVKRMIRLGLIKEDDSRPGRESLYEITPRGELYVRRLFSCRKEDMQK